MVFNSLHFLIFFPLVFLAYLSSPSKLRTPILLLASCYFYMACVPAYLLILFVVIFIDFWAAKAMQDLKGKRKFIVLLVSISANLAILIVFKYAAFVLQNISFFSSLLGYPYSAPILNIVLPLGLSFHTFQSLAYTVEVYRGKVPAERNLMTYALYVLFFPQLVAGPIERPQHLIPQLKKLPSIHPADIQSGLRLMLAGFIKKVLIADNLGSWVDQVYSAPSSASGPAILFATYLFAFQIYCDFSGYADIARGTAKFFGIDLVQNFNRPYLSTSVREFWRRWHISLSTWFRDYVFKPLGGSQQGVVLECRNVMIVFLLSGIWHGSNWTFAIWGSLNGTYLIAEILASYLITRWFPSFERKSPLSKLCGWFLTFNAVSLSWIFFRASSLSDALMLIGGLGHGWNVHQISPNSTNLISLQFLLLGVIVYLSTEWFAESLKPPRFDLWFSKLPVFFRWACYFGGIFLILALGKFEARKFIYFQF